MKKYVFGYEDLLNLKKQKEVDLKNRLSYENGILSKLSEELNKLIFQKENETSIFQSNKKLNKLSDISNFYIYIDNINSIMSEKQKKIEKQKIAIEKMRKNLISISKERQILEKMEETEFEGYKKELIYEEQKINDEIANYKYYSKLLEKTGEVS